LKEGVCAAPNEEQAEVLFLGEVQMNVEKVYGAEKAQSYSGKMMEVGKSAEETFMRWAASEPRNWEWKDVRDSKEYQSRKVDFLFRINGRVGALDVKSDTRIGVTENVLVEVQRDYAGGRSRKGWLLASESHVLVYLNPTTGKLYWFQMRWLRDYYTANKEKLKLIRIASDNAKVTWCALLPLAAFKPVVVELGETK